MTQSDTIFALASGAGKAGVSVFRVSGPKALDVVKALTKGSVPKPRQAALRKFYSTDGAPIDEGLILTFVAPQSFTGETSAEFHTHGSPAVIETMSAAFLAAGIRQAEAGEFTRRAFENGRIDLTEAEGLADLIDAQTEGQRRQAYRQMQGGLKSVYENWRSRLIDALAAIEGEIDFPDEQDVPDALSHRAYEPLKTVIDDMSKALIHSRASERIRAGIQIAIIGPPNAGKSTLLNRLAGREAAIVSDEAGTTRDVIDVHMDIAGLPVSFADTAGLRDTDNRIEAEGVRRALLRSEDADLRIGVLSAETASEISQLAEALEPGDFLLLNKADQAQFDLTADDVLKFSISAKTGEGFEDFLSVLTEAIKTRFALTEQAGLTRMRHRDCAERARTSLERAVENLTMAPELAGDDIRSALHAIKELAGEADIEAVLGAIFSRFCIGK